MFTLDQVRQAHSKVKSGADFPQYIQELIKLGITQYSTYVYSGHTEYTGKGNYQLRSEARYALQDVSGKSDTEKFREYLQLHQQGKTGYPDFCRHCAETGVEKWTADLGLMTCTYFGKAGNKMLVEKIPAP